MHRKKVFATALVGLVAISAADIWVSHQVRQERNTLLDTVSSARHETAKLYDELGFGGLGKRDGREGKSTADKETIHGRDL